MALFYLQISSLSRASGRRATAAAAYRAGERVRDERSGELHNFAQRRDVLHTEIFVPQQFADQPLEWARRRERLWNTAEHAERRHNARVAREFQVNLPAELSPEARLALARTFAGEIAERYRIAVDLAVHAPRAGSDPRNFHAHLLVTTREVTPAGLGAKAGLDLAARERRQRGLPDHRQEYVNVRERWAELANAALSAENRAERIDHRSLAAQGVDREPRPRIPLMHLRMEQRGVRSELAERLRSEYRARVAAREEKQVAKDATPALNAPRDLEEVRRQARTAWLKLRERGAAQEAPSLDAGHARDEDLSP
ncbi:MAG: MobA/MobL family protein [Proteobacteria bacterium]|nr:MobA/MobL family protein [Pseudomonadota bacterium]